MNKTGLALILGLLIFSAGGMQGRLGSLLAVFIDPASLQDVSGSNSGTVTPGNGSNLPAVPNGPLTHGTPSGPATMKPDANGQCKPGYLLISGVCYRYVEQAN